MSKHIADLIYMREIYIYKTFKYKSIDLYKSFIHRFISQMPIRTRVGSGRSQEPRIHSGYPTWMAGIKGPVPPPALSWDLY